jgi:hypothetical protein
MKTKIVTHVEVSELTGDTLDAINRELECFNGVTSEVGITRTDVETLDGRLNNNTPFDRADAHAAILAGHDCAVKNNIEEVVFTK